MIIKVILGCLIGGAVGFGIGYVMRCSGGACPLTCNPYLSTTLGAIGGILLTLR